MKKTKIICSIGPACDNYDMLRNMILNGMNVARINFSHAKYEDIDKALYLLDILNKELGTKIGVMFDTKGPDFRTGELESEYITLEENSILRIEKGDFIGNNEIISVNFDNAIDCINIGNSILLEDGLMKLEVISKDEKGLSCKVINGGELGERKSINVPGVKLNIPFISETDRNDIKYSCARDGDFLALSFVSSKDDVLEIKKIVNNTNIQIISKIENAEGIKNIDEIIEYSDGIMIARGDLGVELPMERIPIFQKEIIKKCRAKGKICIVATEMLASMYKSPRPTRAEVTDIANAVLDGADAIMLSGETTIGKFPDDAVKFMSTIAENAEGYMDYNLDRRETKMDITGAIAHSVIETANILHAKLVVAATMTGYTAKKISNLKPRSLILATCPSMKTAKSLSLNWGVYAEITKIYESTDEVVEDAISKAKKFMNLKDHDIIIITGCLPNDKKQKSTNIMKVEEIDLDEVI